MRRSLPSVILLAIVITPAVALAADQIDWSATAPSSGIVVGNEVVVEGRGVHPLVTIHDPDIGGDEYAVSGVVRYQDVAGAGYLEMWSHFADGGAYFSRTLGTAGPGAALVGSSPERPFALPFFLQGAAGPQRIEVNVVLPDGGTVWVGPLQLDGFGTSGVWWSERRAGTVGAVLGVVAGLLGTTVGLLHGTRRGPRVVVGLLVAGVAAGVLLLAAGGAAIILSQPWHVAYPLLLTGLILTLVCSVLLPRVRQASEADELRRMRALDA